MSLTASNLSFHFPKSPLLFNNLSLTIDKNQIVGLFGINGAGKTTLLKLLSGLLFPKSGTCTMQDLEGKTHYVRNREPGILSDLVILPEQFELPRMTAERYRAVYAPFYPRFDAGIFATLLNEFDIKDYMAGAITLDKLSYGQQKKFLIAFSIATNATYLLLDEPTNGLDIPSKSQFRRVLARDLFQDRSVIISTHQVRDLGQSIDHLLILHNHKIALSESMDRLSEVFQMTRSGGGEGSGPAGGGASMMYSEPVLGGHMILTQRSPDSKGGFSRDDEDADSLPFDMEFFFNAVISETDAVRDALAGHNGRSENQERVGQAERTKEPGSDSGDGSTNEPESQK